jgi:riboflavin kinase/FMN adenylyltransferase
VKLLRNLEDLPSELRGGAVSIGNFDGVHWGHAQLATRLCELARQVDGPAIVFTFDPHPVRLLRPSQMPPPLTSTPRKAELLAELGVQAMIAYPTTPALLQLSADDFFHTIVCQQLGALALVEGPNFFFGHDRQGNIARLGELTSAAGLRLEVVPPVELAGQIVSSSRVRQALASGDVDAARAMLTRPYRLVGQVIHGAARGAQIGFPTANLGAVDTLLPAQGVYAGLAGAAALGRWPAAIHIGPNPTFGEAAVKIEVHLIGFTGTLYDTPLEVDFLSQVRSVRSFASVEELKQQLQSDVARAAQIAAEYVNAPRPVPLS